MTRSGQQASRKQIAQPQISSGSVDDTLWSTGLRKKWPMQADAANRQERLTYAGVRAATVGGKIEPMSTSDACRQQSGQPRRPLSPAPRCSPAAVTPIDCVVRHCQRPACSPSLPTKSRGPWPLTLHILGELGRSPAAVGPTASSVISGAPMLAGSDSPGEKASGSPTPPRCRRQPHGPGTRTLAVRSRANRVASHCRGTSVSPHRESGRSPALLAPTASSVTGGAGSTDARRQQSRRPRRLSLPGPVSVAAARARTLHANHVVRN